MVEFVLKHWVEDQRAFFDRATRRDHGKLAHRRDHQTVALAVNNLAQLLKTTNRLAEAEPLMRRVVEVFEKNLGKDHPNVALALNNLSR